MIQTLDNGFLGSLVHKNLTFDFEKSEFWRGKANFSECDIGERKMDLSLVVAEEIFDLDCT